MLEKEVDEEIENDMALLVIVIAAISLIVQQAETLPYLPQID
jgi:hypothetical protein